MIRNMLDHKIIVSSSMASCLARQCQELAPGPHPISSRNPSVITFLAESKMRSSDSQEKQERVPENEQVRGVTIWQH